MLPILLALAFIALLFIVLVVGQPDDFKLSRSANIAAPPENLSHRYGSGLPRSPSGLI